MLRARMLIVTLFFLGLFAAVVSGCGGGSSSPAAGAPAAVAPAAPVTLSSIALTPATSSVAVRRTLALSATGTYSNGSTADLTTQVTWAASNGNATVSNAGGTQGTVTGVTVGASTISATLSGVSAAATLQVTPPPAFSGTWVEMGPDPIYMSSQLTANVSGRLTALLPLGVNTLLAGSASGGVWKTRDNGRSWVPVSDSQQSLVIGAFARDPNAPNVILAGTGEANALGQYTDTPLSSRQRAGVGILRSTDSGDTWSLMSGSAVLGRMGTSRIAFDPNDPTSQRIFVSTCRATFGGTTPAFGLYLSTNGGQTFQSLSTGAANALPLNKPVMDFCFQPGNAQVMLATVTDAGAQSGIWRSADGGATWTPVLVSATYGRISLAAARTVVAPTPGVFYALIGQTNGAFATFVYGSNDNGLTWRGVCPTNSGSTYGAGLDVNIVNEPTYCSAIAVDPSDAATIYIASVELCRVGGINIAAPSWASAARLTQGYYDAAGAGTGGLAGSPHVDMHALAFDAAGNLLLGCDGGLWRLANPSLCGAFPATPWTNLNGGEGGRGLATTQLYGIALAPTASFAWGGFQDNGNAYFDGSRTWNQPQSGDGGFPVIDPTNPSTVWLTFNSGPPVISTDNGVTFNTFGSGNVYDTGEPAQFPNPPTTFVVQGTGTRVATARQSVYEVAPGASDYINASGGPLVTGSEIITALAYAPGHPEVLYAGTSLGHMFVRRQLPGAFTEISNGLPGTVVTIPLISGIAVDPNDPNEAWCTVMAYDVPHVLHTTNGGATWTDASGNLPNVPADCVASLVLDNKTFVDDPVLFVGTDLGVYASQDDGVTWTRAGSGLPNVPVSQLAVVEGRNVMTAATYGRGAWTISLDPTVLVTPTPAKTAHPAKRFAPFGSPLPPRPAARR